MSNRPFPLEPDRALPATKLRSVTSFTAPRLTSRLNFGLVVPYLQFLGQVLIFVYDTGSSSVVTALGIETNERGARASAQGGG